MNRTSLVKAAATVREFAYAPYSNFRVGAAVMSKSGNVFVGCNIENASLGLTICAERAAVAAALANGNREFVAIAVVTDFPNVVFPCGACRQILSEFNPSMDVIAATTQGKSETISLAELLPRPSEKILRQVPDV